MLKDMLNFLEKRALPFFVAGVSVDGDCGTSSVAESVEASVEAVGFPFVVGAFEK
jgi:ribosome biogenesis protein Tsr3